MNNVNILNELLQKYNEKLNAIESNQKKYQNKSTLVKMSLDCIEAIHETVETPKRKILLASYSVFILFLVAFLCIIFQEYKNNIIPLISITLLLVPFFITIYKQENKYSKQKRELLSDFKNEVNSVDTWNLIKELNINNKTDLVFNELQRALDYNLVNAFGNLSKLIKCYEKEQDKKEENNWSSEVEQEEREKLGKDNESQSSYEIYL